MPTKTKTIWTKTLMQVYQKYPASIRSKDWSTIVSLANSGDKQKAESIAKAHEAEHKSHRAQNVIARRIRIQRVALFALQKQTTERLKATFKVSADAISGRALRTAPLAANLARMKKANHEVIVDLRRALLTILTDSIWSAIILGVKNMGEAIKPILRDNQESFQQELKEISLIEGKLTFDVGKSFANQAKGHVTFGSDKWTGILDNLYQSIAKEASDDGMTLSDRVWDLTNRMEMDLRRMLANDIAQGTSASDIADQIEQYVYVNGLDDAAQTGPGIYRSPLKNALRVARTETSRAYSSATAAWADEKDWVQGLSVTLSPAHDVEDECDDLAGEIYSPEEFPDIIPAHPHCMCYGTYVIDDSKLVDPTEADQTDQEEED